MSDGESPKVGTVGWRDLTVQNAEVVRDFYRDVVGFKAEPVEMDGYNDFTMIAPGTGEPVAGVCHARGSNADIPPQWLLYFIVEDVEKSAARCAELGGKLVVPVRELAGGRFCVIQDPAGAVCALYQP